MSADSRRPGLRLLASPVLLAAIALALVHPVGTAAWFTDEAAMNSGTVAAATIPAPTLSCGTTGLLSRTFTWTAVTGATTYTFHYDSGGANTATVNAPTTQFQVSGLITSGTASVVAHRNFGSVTWDSVVSNTRNYNITTIFNTCS